MRQASAGERRRLKPRRKRSTTSVPCRKPLSERETAELFLSDVAAAGTDGVGPSSSVDQRTLPADARKKVKKAPVTVTKRGKEKKGAKLNVKVALEEVVAASGPGGITLPLEEGEDDPSVSVEVLQQTAAFLAALTPSRSHRFWACRRVARGEAEGEVDAALEVSSTDSDITDGGTDGSNEEESNDLEDARDSGDYKECPTGSMAGRATASKHATKKPNEEAKGTNKNDGGLLFKSNPDIWDD
ncbi:hypothetical protein, conserved [Trypanosoma brucei gambiense DAL972]|uniref:Uncharacterized protein n=1 Tax=Trypanosoma brucei gambiense (strain MHOM/CI/86/DAL972) TaxID=679716 RepID=D0A8Q0_TRYB9|nr:hypothetical protein, conserved [Trypanosoma brucei gambiense DAL972]CBH18051.1 hypothetical protein, conserved [Trypanosoma brucei gambiense DAL972]|eukprot:XP_011780315.1 hypothetical protein, conserved [Trypanosoma brucei gambiense DAL972]